MEKRLDRNNYERDHQEIMADLLPVIAVLLFGVACVLLVILTKWPS